MTGLRAEMPMMRKEIDGSEKLGLHSKAETPAVSGGKA
jgi:hypothetical protein